MACTGLCQRARAEHPPASPACHARSRTVCGPQTRTPAAPRHPSGPRGTFGPARFSGRDGRGAGGGGGGRGSTHIICSWEGGGERLGEEIRITSLGGGGVEAPAAGSTGDCATGCEEGRGARGQDWRGRWVSAVRGGGGGRCRTVPHSSLARSASRRRNRDSLISRTSLNSRVNRRTRASRREDSTLALPDMDKMRMQISVGNQQGGRWGARRERCGFSWGQGPALTQLCSGS